MTGPRRRTAWAALADEWDPDHPAIARMREGLALRPTDEPGRPEDAPAAAAGESGPPEASERRSRIRELVRKVAKRRFIGCRGLA
jgi:hypothetical protein